MPGYGSTRSVDKMDLDLIRELEIDPLARHAELGARVSTSPATVSRRIRRLLDKRIIAITTMPSPPAFGYGMQATIVVNVTGGKVNEVADELASYPSVQYVIITTGHYDIIAWAVFRGSADLFDFVRKGLGSISNLASAETMTGLKIAKSSWSLLTQENRWGETPAAQVSPDDLQLRIMSELEKDPRQNHTELAEKLGVVRHTVRRKLKALLDNGMIRVVTIPDPLVLGYRTRAGILAKVHPGKIDAVADRLAAHSRIQHVIISTGRYDIMAWAVFRDPEELSAFVRGELGGIPGIISHETVLNLRVAKGSLKLVTGDTL